MRRSLGFGSTACDSTPSSDSLSLRLPPLSEVNLAALSNSPVHYAKGTQSGIILSEDRTIALLLLVGI